MTNKRHRHRDEVLRLWARTGTAKYEHWKEDYEGQAMRVRLSPCSIAS